MAEAKISLWLDGGNEIVVTERSVIPVTDPGLGVQLLGEAFQKAIRALGLQVKGAGDGGTGDVPERDGAHLRAGGGGDP